MSALAQVREEAQLCVAGGKRTTPENVYVLAQTTCADQVPSQHGPVVWGNREASPCKAFRLLHCWLWTFSSEAASDATPSSDACHGGVASLCRADVGAMTQVKRELQYQLLCELCIFCRVE